jgi:hypothetical protein
MIVEGLPCFASPARMKQMLIKMMAMPEGHLRRFGLILMVAGLGLVYLGRR